MCSNGDCFMVLPPNCAEQTLIFGRNSVHDDAVDKAQEVVYYEASAASEGKCDGGAEPEVIGSLRVILQKPLPGVWGGDYGANEKNVCMGITWTSAEPGAESGHLLATDIVRYTLAAATSATDAVEQIGLLVAAHGAGDAKSSYVICDASEAWAVSCCGKLWAAQRFTAGYKRFACSGLAVSSVIDKSSENLGDALQAMGLWNGEGDLDFAVCCGAACNTTDAWSGDEPSADATYTLNNMFGTLRAHAASTAAGTTRSATVSVLTAVTIACHWFTATPDPRESVFKPFVFAPSPKISPLTLVSGENTVTLLHKLHAQRKSTAVNDLQCLEASCVEELNKYFAEQPSANEELDELMKDCVEAEVKFYR